MMSSSCKETGVMGLQLDSCPRGLVGELVLACQVQGGERKWICEGSVKCVDDL